MLTVTQTPTYYELAFKYNPFIVQEIKKVQGYRYNAVRKIWTLPADKSEDVKRLMKRYGVPDLQKREEEYDVIPELPNLIEEYDAILSRNALIKPFPYQKKGIAYNLINKRVIVGDQPGLGKTLQAILTAFLANRKCILVICPSSLKINWQREFEKFIGWKSIILTDKVKNTWQQYFRVGMCKVFITNYESLKKYFVDNIITVTDQKTGKKAPLRLNHIQFKDCIKQFDMVICDEMHKCKDGRTQQAKFVMGIAKGKEYVLGLTGTPVVNKPKDLVSQLHILQRLNDFGGYKTFMDRYCGGNGSGAFNLKELNYKLSTTCFYQRQKKDVLKELPDKMRQIILCDITTMKEYEEAVNDLANYLKEFKSKSEQEIDKSMRGEIMVRIGICKNISARGKMNEVIDHIDEVIESGEKIVVFIHQKEIAMALLKHYPHAVSVRGDDNMDARQKAVDSFQNDPKTNIIICSIKAAGVGLTLTASSRVAFVELPWHPADCDQCEDRTHRIGQKNSVQCTYFLGKDTIDEDIYKLIEEKREVANTITGSVDDVQREIIDRITGSLFDTKKEAA